MRLLTFSDAINEALYQEMERDERVFVYGIGVADHKKIFGTTKNLLEAFGRKRCFDTPIAEDSMTGLGLGAAIAGLRPVHIHIRADFLLLAMNQLGNVISSCFYGSGGKIPVPMVIRAVVGRGWGQGYQHSKSMHSIFAHIPGLKVVVPATPYDAKGLLISAIRDDNPVLLLEHRWLYWQEGEVPEESYLCPIGKGKILREGHDITVVATSWMNVEANHAAVILEKYGVSVEIINLLSLNPLDIEVVVQSVMKTQRCLVVDNDWILYGAGAEIAAQINDRCIGYLESPVTRIGFPNSPCPSARHLENVFYPNAKTIVRSVEAIVNIQPIDLSGESFFSHEIKFKGPF